MAKFALYLPMLVFAIPVVLAQEGVVEVGETKMVTILEKAPVSEVVPALETTPSPKPRKPPRPHLVCYPSPGSYSRTGLAGITRGFAFSAIVWVSDPNERFWCPEVEWEVSGIRSSHQEDCDPYDQIVAEEGEPPSTWSPDNPFRKRLGVGRWVIIVRLRKAGKTLWTDHCEADVR